MSDRRTILIVDDSPEDRATYQRFLGKNATSSFEIIEAASGEAGLRLCDNSPPDCILLDYNLPDMDGVEFLVALHERHNTTFAPVVMLTGQGDESVAVKAMKADAQDYLVKDALAANDLHRAIDNAIEKIALQREVERQRRELERSNEELERFAYVVSHDLQTPLRAVSGFCELLQRRYKSKLDEDADEFLGFAVSGARRMQEMINGLLAYSRVGLRDRTLEMVDLEKSVDAALANLKTEVAESGAEISCDPLPSVLGTPTQMLQLFQNLIGNAIKYRGTAPPRIGITCQREDGHWRFGVHDNGIGIDDKNLATVFSIFKRLHSDSEYSGTGIGLAICQKIVEHHGGRIWVESDPGQGCSFHFTLPATTS